MHEALSKWISKRNYVKETSMSLENADILCRNCVCKKDEAANDTT